MKQIDRLIMKELVGPWLFGVGLFSSLLMAATYLGRIAGFIVDQVPPALVGQLVMLLFPAILVKTFTMAVLLAALMAFGRLSSDSEIVALRAGGASIFRIVVPVMVFSLIIAIVTFWFDEQVVPSASRRSQELQAEIVKKTEIKSNQPIARTIVYKGKLRLGIVAQNVNPASEALQGVTMVVYNDVEQPQFYIQAKQLVYHGLTSGFEKGLSSWRLEEATIMPYQAPVKAPDGTARIAQESQVIYTESAWPEQLPNIKQSFTELTAVRKDEFDLMSMKELRTEIDKHKANEDWKPAEISNAEYGYWNKLSVPLAAFVFGTLGAVLGIRNHRTGTAAGFALAIAIIFGYVTLANFMNVWASGGVLPAYVASFAPITLGFIASGIIMWRRNA